MGQWGLKPSRGPRRRQLRGAGRDRGPAAAAHVAGAGPDRGAARGGRGLRLLPLRQRGQRPDRARPRRDERAGAVHLPPAAARPAAVPGRLLPARGLRRRPTWSAFQLATMGPRISEATAELFAKNAYRDYLELHGLSVQLTEALAEYWHARVRARARHRRRRIPATWTASSGSATGARGTPSATRPARTWPTGPRWCACSSRTASASSCPRRCSCIPSSPPTRSSCTTPRRSTSASEPVRPGRERSCSTWTGC